jgi:hypothetical protein
MVLRTCKYKLQRTNSVKVHTKYVVTLYITVRLDDYIIVQYVKMYNFLWHK